MFGADYAPDCVACLEGVENGIVAYGSVCSGDLVLVIIMRRVRCGVDAHRHEASA